MAGGELFAEVIAVAAVVIGGAWLIWIMRRATDDLRMNGAWGDVPAIPPSDERRAD